MSKNITLTIFRGVHTLDTVPQLAKELEQMDLLFLENPGLKSEKAVYESLLNRITQKPSDQPPIDLSLIPNIDVDFYFQLAFKLRGPEKFIRLVDYEFDTQAEFDDHISRMYKDIDRQIFANPHKRYTLIDDLITEQARVCADRDKLVAKQIVTFLSDPKLRGIIDRMAYFNIALVQGYVHRSIKMLKASLKDIKITEKIFAPEMVEYITKSNHHFTLLEKKMDNPGAPLPKKDMDYYSYQLLMLASHWSASQQLYKGKTAQEHIIEQIAEGKNHAVIKFINKHAGEIKPIDAYSAEELSQAVLDICSRSILA